MRPRIYADYALWALGFGGFLAFVGGVLVAPPDPVSQVVWTTLLAVGTVPGMYLVVASAWERHERGRSRRLVAHFVTATVVGTAAVLAVGAVAPPVDAAGGATPLWRAGRALAFLAAVGVVSWLFYGRD